MAIPMPAPPSRSTTAAPTPLAPWTDSDSGGPSQEDADEGRSDSVVETAFHVQHSSDSGGHPRVLHDRGAERGIGRRHRGADRGSHPEPGVPVEAGGHDAAETDRERQPDAEEADGQAGVGSELSDVDP